MSKIIIEIIINLLHANDQLLIRNSLKDDEIIKTTKKEIIMIDLNFELRRIMICISGLRIHFSGSFQVG